MHSISSSEKTPSKLIHVAIYIYVVMTGDAVSQLVTVKCHNIILCMQSKNLYYAHLCQVI